MQFVLPLILGAAALPVLCRASIDAKPTAPVNPVVATSPLFERQLARNNAMLSYNVEIPASPTDEEAIIIWNPISGSLTSGCALSGCSASGCGGSGCFGSLCGLSGCIASGCTASGCVGSACVGSGCVGSGCGGSGCVGSGCIYSGCLVSACVGSGCLGSGCVGSACLGSGCVVSGCVGSGCLVSGCVLSACIAMVSCSANSGCHGLACLPGYTPPVHVGNATLDGDTTGDTTTTAMTDYTGNYWWNILCDEANGLYDDHHVVDTGNLDAQN